MNSKISCWRLVRSILALLSADRENERVFVQ
jgi:hypothetical protein